MPGRRRYAGAVTTDLDWNDLRFVLAIAREGSLSRAGRALGVNHTTVSRRLAHLERSIGVRLFDRTPEGHLCTPAGQDLLAAAERIEAEVLGLERKVLGRDDRIEGRLVFTALEAMAVVFSRDLVDFQRAHPDVELVLETGSEVLDLNRREADVALRASNAPDPTLFGRRLGRMEFALYGARSLVEQRDGVGGLPWIGWHERLGAEKTEARMRTVAPDAQVVARFTDILPFQAALEAGLGIGFITCLYGDSRNELIRLREPEKDFGLDLWLLTHPDLRHTARVRAFMDFFARAFEPYRARFEGRTRPPRGVPSP
jgi:DNA-binding transcriptional LysR family regulator